MKHYQKLATHTFSSREKMGEAAARYAVKTIQEAHAARGEARVVFASAPSQDDLFASLVSPAFRDQVDWSKVTAFHLDEYVGFNSSRRESFRSYLHRNLMDHLPSKPTFIEIQGEAADLEAECRRYAASFSEKPIDLVCLGIGENGHLAFNDPAVADFHDTLVIKVVTLEDSCRRQQVNDGCFPSFEAVPSQALTLTVPAIFSARQVCAVVPGVRKAQAVRETLLGPVSEVCPGSILRTHACATMFLDQDSASLLSP